MPFKLNTISDEEAKSLSEYALIEYKRLKYLFSQGDEYESPARAMTRLGQMGISEDTDYALDRLDSDSPGVLDPKSIIDILEFSGKPSVTLDSKFGDEIQISFKTLNIVYKREKIGYLSFEDVKDLPHDDLYAQLGENPYQYDGQFIFASKNRDESKKRKILAGPTKETVDLLGLVEALPSEKRKSGCVYRLGSENIYER